MKNLKKTLSLVLVIAMVCSLFVSVNAAAFKDQADIDNATAAAVLNEIGVITGYTDGSFKPEGVLTRAEGATIIARLLLGEDAETYTAAGNPFDDVKATDWHAGYIAYCVAEGIAAGYGNGKFGPNDTLTVAQFGKMLLNALGYESGREGFTGADWSTAVGKYINKLGLAEGAATALNASCTRQVAAQMALNTLKSTMVEYASGSTTIKGEGMEIVVGGSAAEKVEWAAAVAGTRDGKVLAADGYVQFAEEYFPLLRLQGSGNNNFGRPAVNAWSIRGTELGTEESNADLLKTYTGTVTKGAMYDLLGKKIVNELTAGTSTLTVYVDGDTVTAGAITNIFDDSSAAKGDAITTTGAAYPTGNGVVTEVYLEETATNYVVTIVIVNTYIAVADADYDEETETLDVTVYGAAGTGFAGTETLSVEDFDVAGYEEGDYLLVTVDGNGTGTAAIATIAPAKTVSGTIDTYTASASDWLRSITVGGKKYSYSKKVINSGEGDPTLVNAAMKNTDVTLVLDAAGYVISFAEAEVVANYVYLTEIASESSFTSKASFVAAVYFTDGTYEEIALEKIYNTSRVEQPITEGKSFAGWYTYSVNAEGKYVLSDVAVANNPSYSDTTITGNEVVFYDNAKANAKTVFVVVDEEGESTVFTGYRNMSDVSAATGTLVVDVLVDDETGFATYVFATVSGGTINVSGATKDNTTMVYIYRAGMFTETVDADDNVYYTNTYALVNGVKSTINTESNSWGTGLYIGVEYDNVTGYIKDMTAVNTYDANEWLGSGKADDAVYATFTTSDAIIYDGDILVIGANDYAVAEDCDIVLVEGTSYSKISMSTLVNKSGKISGSFYGAVNADGQLTALYVAV